MQTIYIVNKRIPLVLPDGRHDTTFSEVDEIFSDKTMAEKYAETKNKSKEKWDRACVFDVEEKTMDRITGKYFAHRSAREANR